MDETLKEAQRSLLRSGTTGNPALEGLLEDYRRYHAVLATVGGILLLGLITLSVVMWRMLVTAPRPAGRRWTFERRTYLTFGILSGVVGLGMALIVAANVSTVLSPRQGFAGSIGMIRPAAPGSAREALVGSVATWLSSGSPETPPLLQQAIDDRLAWQRPKAVVCIVLLLAVVALGFLVWRSLTAGHVDEEEEE